MNPAEDAFLATIKRRPVKKPSVITIARNVLQDDLQVLGDGSFRLFDGYGWHPANLGNVMRVVNHRLKDRGQKQITVNQCWIV